MPIYFNIIYVQARYSETEQLTDVRLTDAFLRPAQVTNQSVGTGVQPENFIRGLLRTNMLLTDG